MNIHQLRQLAADLQTRIAIDAAAPRPPRAVLVPKKQNARILFHAKAAWVDERLTDYEVLVRIARGELPASKKDLPIGQAMAKAASLKSNDWDVPRRVCGESKAIKAEQYYADPDTTWTQRMLNREQARR